MVREILFWLIVPIPTIFFIDFFWQWKMWAGMAPSPEFCSDRRERNIPTAPVEHSHRWRGSPDILDADESCLSCGTGEATQLFGRRFCQ
jgi:hypothetical protein